MHHLYRWILRGVLRRLDDRCIYSLGLYFGDQLFGGCSATVSATASTGGDSRSRRRRQSRRPDPRRSLSLHAICRFKTPAITVAPRCFAVNAAERPTFPGSTRDQNRLARLDSGSGKELVPGHRHQRQCSCLDEIEPWGNFASFALYHTKFRISIVCHREHPVTNGESFHSRPNLVPQSPRYRLRSGLGIFMG